LIVEQKSTTANFAFMAFNEVKIYDTLMNFIVLTPLVLAFWQGTSLLIDDITSRYLHSNGQVSEIMLLVIGAGIEFVITYWQV
jgi:Fuseless